MVWYGMVYVLRDIAIYPVSLFIVYFRSLLEHLRQIPDAHGDRLLVIAALTITYTTHTHPLVAMHHHITMLQTSTAVAMLCCAIPYYTISYHTTRCNAD